MITIGDLIADQMRSNREEEATPESLRAAAKVLEDKAKELEKTKLTLGQKGWLDGKYSDITDKGVLLSKDGKRGWYTQPGYTCEVSLSATIKELEEGRLGWPAVHEEFRHATIRSPLYGDIPVVVNNIGSFRINVSRL